MVDQHRTLLRVLDCRGHVLQYRFPVIRNHHRTTAQHVARTNQHGVADTLGTGKRLFDAGGQRALRLRNLKIFNQLAEPLAILGQIDRLGRCANDGNTGLLERQRQVQRSLTAELHDHADLRPAGSLVLIDAEHIFQRQRLKVEAVAGVVVGRDGFRVAVHHDRLVAIFAQCKRSMAAAVVELYALPDAVRTAAKDHHLLLRGWRCLVFFVVAAVKVRREALELARAGVDHLVDRHHVQLFTQRAHRRRAFRARQTPA